jgi:predicted nucleic acid-binding protein
MALQIPEGGFVLLDTNVLIDTSKYPVEFSSLHIELKRLNISAIIESTIQFEFLRGLKNPSDGEILLDELCGKGRTVLAPDKDIFERASHISRIYYKTDNKMTKIADVLIAAQICRYARSQSQQNELLLATQNHRDFPPVLFERVEDTFITLADGSIKVVGFYRFRKDNYDKFKHI